MLASNLVQAAVVGMIGVLYSFGSLSFLVLLVMLFVLNSGAQFVRPAVQAIIPGITEKEDLSTASSLFSLSTSANQVAGSCELSARGPSFRIKMKSMHFSMHSNALVRSP